jgi:hypothetical protein
MKNRFLKSNTLKYFVIVAAMFGFAGSSLAQKVKVVRDSDSVNILAVKKSRQ